MVTKVKGDQLNLLISDATIISNITDPTNRSGNTYTGDLSGLIENNYYYDSGVQYKFDGTTLYRTTDDQDLSGYLDLDQTTPQTIENGIPLLDQTNGSFDDPLHLINKEYVDKRVRGGGGFVAPVFFRSDLSDVPVGSEYNRLDYVPETTETQITKTFKASDGEVLCNTFIYDDELGTTQLEPGVYNAVCRSKISHHQGITKIIFEAFVRTTGGVETTLFRMYSPEIDNSDFETLQFSSIEPAFTVNETDRFGVRMFVETTRNANITLTAVLGGEYGSYFSTPISLRHNLLRARDEADSHPIDAITGLQTELDDRLNKTTDTYLESVVAGDNITIDTTDPKNPVINGADGLAVEDINKLYQPDGTNPFVYTDNSGALHIDGDIIQSGSTYETHAEQVYTTKDMIITRDGAVAGLGAGEYTGIKAKLYDGVNDGLLVFDSSGYARVGDVGDTVRIAAVEDTPTDGYYARYNNTTEVFDTVQIDYSEIQNTPDTSLLHEQNTDDRIIDGTTILRVSGSSGYINGGFRATTGTGSGFNHIRSGGGTKFNTYINSGGDGAIYMRDGSGTDKLILSTNGYSSFRGGDVDIRNGKLAVGTSSFSNGDLTVKSSSVSNVPLVVMSSNGNRLAYFYETASNNGRLYLRDGSDSIGVLLASGTRSYISNKLNIGIASSTEFKTLTVRYDNNTTSYGGQGLGGGAAGDGILTQNNSTTGGAYANLDFRVGTADGRILYRYISSNRGDFHFIDDDGNDMMRIRHGGLVGIGGISPTKTLDVNGGIRTRSNYYSSDNSAGYNGTFSFVDNDSNSRTLTIKDGLVTAVS